MAAMFGRSRDIGMFFNINNELLGQIIEQKIGYYQVVLDETSPNIYGENLNKTFKGPVLINCLLERGAMESSNDDFGVDITRPLTIRFFKPHLITANIVPNIGDIVLWNEDYYEIDNVVENQLVVGKDPNYAYTDENFVPDAGTSLSIIVTCHYTRPERVGLRDDRL
jgi:hypothetical protein